MADRKQDPSRRADRQADPRKSSKENRQPSLDVSGVVFEKGNSPGGGSVQKNEGEGNRTAARKYNDATRRFVQSGRVQESGERAKSAIEGGERAEKVGKSKMREEDPAVERKSHK